MCVCMHFSSKLHLILEWFLILAYGFGCISQIRLGNTPIRQTAEEAHSVDNHTVTVLIRLLII